MVEVPSPLISMEKDSSSIDSSIETNPSPSPLQQQQPDLQTTQKCSTEGGSNPEGKEEFLFSCLLCKFECDHLSSLYVHLQTPPHTVQICPPQFTNPKVRIAEWVKPKQEAPPPPKAFRSILSDMNFATYEELETHARSSPHTAGIEKRKRGGV